MSECRSEKSTAGQRRVSLKVMGLPPEVGMTERKKIKKMQHRSISITKYMATGANYVSVF